MFENLNWMPLWVKIGIKWRNEYYRCGDLVKIDLIYNTDKNKHYISPRVEGTGLLHRLLMKPPRNMVIDHINRNPLDNRRINLRICTVDENNRNLSLRKNNTSGNMGVYYKPDKKNKPWVAQKYYRGAWLPIKLFKTKEEAIAHRKYLDETYK